MTFYAIEPLTWQPQNDCREVVDLLSMSVAHFERRLETARLEVRHKRARLEVLRLESVRLREDAEQWGEIVNRESRCAGGRKALRKLIEKSRGLAAVNRLAERLERDLAALEPKIGEHSAAIRELRQQLRGQWSAAGSG